MKEPPILQLAALPRPSSCLTALISTSIGHELQFRHCADTMSVRPVQIAQGEERQANIIQHYSTPVEGRGDAKKAMKDMMKNHEDYEDAEEAARWYAEEAARLHALKVVEVLKNEIKVNEDFDAVDHSMQNEESKMMKMKSEDESCVDIADEKCDAKLLEGQLSAVFENKIKQHKDEISVDPIEEVADTTTKPVKYEEQADWIDPKVENMMRNKIKDYDQHQKMKKIMKRLTTLEDQEQNQRTLNKKIRRQLRTMKKKYEPTFKNSHRAERKHINKRKTREEVRTDARKSMNPVIRKRFSHTDYERELMEHHDYDSARSSSWDKMSYESDNTPPINGRFHFDDDSSDDSFDVRQQ